MAAKIFNIKNATRYPLVDEHDKLDLMKGVNVIVGELNAGKTKWLQMIDYVLGDTGKPEEAFDQELANKYQRIVLIIDIEGEEIAIERRWKETGKKSKIIVNEEAKTPKQFSEFILGKLNIPIIYIPSGNPYADRSWPELSWRELFRHMYKQERFWSDFAQKQGEVVRSACILHFLNASGNLYPTEFGELVSKRKKLGELKAQKDVFINVLQDVAVDLIGQPEMTIAVTPDSISETRRRLEARQIEIDRARAEALKSYDKEVIADVPAFDTIKQNLENLHLELGKTESERNIIANRMTELTEYANNLETELDRFARAKVGASIFADLKVTHCPACDQEVPDRSHDPNLCPVCGKTRVALNVDESKGRRRIEFEEQQVTEELIELRRLIQELEQELSACNIQIGAIKGRIQARQRSIRSAEALAVRAIPPDVAILDVEAGRIAMQLEQLDRIEKALLKREDINLKIAILEEQIRELEAEVNSLNSNIDYHGLEDLLSDRMNDYLNSVNTENLSRWKTGRVSVKLRKDSFDILLDGQPWTIRAGGTASYIIQIAYHYALFSLTKDFKFNYPGFIIIDFPPHFAKAEDLRGSENYLIKPFVDICKNENMFNAQVIIAGRAFHELEGANIICL